MAKKIDSYEYEDGSGGVVEQRDGRNLITTHYTPKDGYQKAPRPTGPQSLRMGDVGKPEVVDEV